MKSNTGIRNTLRTKTLELFIIIMLLLSLLLPVACCVTIEPGYGYTIENETYNMSTPIDFSSIRHSDTYIVFDDIGFNITSPDVIVLNFSSLNTALVEFNVTLESGSTDISISGMGSGVSYAVERNSSLLSYMVSDGVGVLDINVTCGQANYKIYGGSATVEPEEDGSYDDKVEDGDVGVLFPLDLLVIAIVLFVILTFLFAFLLKKQ